MKKEIMAILEKLSQEDQYRVLKLCRHLLEDTKRT